MISEKGFEESWKSSHDEQNKINDLTDKRIWDGIENKIKKKKSAKKLYWAAAALIPLFVFLMIFKIADDPKKETVEKNYAFETIENSKIFRLPDGSVIELKPHSKMFLSNDFGDKDRKVSFVGKGIFSVAKDKTKPFRIDAGDFKIQVLGTKFFLDQKSEEKKVELFEGKVKIEHGSEITYLLPKEIWLVDENKIGHHYFNPEKQQDFVFNNSNYSEAIEQLENTYHIKIFYPEKFKDKKVSGSFSGNLSEVLSVMSFPFNLKPEYKNEKEIILK